jgi:hypothetical protein
MKARIEANQESMWTIQQEMEAKMDSHQEEMKAKMEAWLEKMKPN